MITDPTLSSTDPKPSAPKAPKVIRITPRPALPIPQSGPVTRAPRPDGLPGTRWIDRLGRPLTDLRISVTDHCNFRCRYCMPKEKYAQNHNFLAMTELLTFDEILRVSRIAVANGIEKIALENHGCQMVYNPETLIRLRDAVGPMVGMNLDPSHLMWMGGDPVTAVHKLGADRIYHVHAKDVRLERNYVGPDGVLDTKTIDQFAKRTWNYVALGHGHDVSWWKEFLSCLSMEGYDGPISQEMEDLTMPALTGLKKSTAVLKEAMPCDL